MTDITQADRDAVPNDCWFTTFDRQSVARALARHREAAFQAGVKAMQEAAAEAAFKRLHPHESQPESDWTEFAKQQAIAALMASSAIRAIDPTSIKDTQ